MLDAYDYFLRAMASHYESTREASNEALKLFYAAIALDPNFASSHGWASACYTVRKQSKWMVDPEVETREGLRLARRATELGRDDEAALALGGFGLAFLGDELDAGAAFIERALAPNSNFANAWHVSGWVSNYLGEHETAIEHLARAMRLSPLDPLMHQMTLATANAHYFAGRFDEASSLAARVRQQRPSFVPALVRFASSCAMAGRLEEARDAMAQALQFEPTLCISGYGKIPLRRLEDRNRREEGLRLAGFPE